MGMMSEMANKSRGPESAFLQDALLSLLVGTNDLPASELTRVVNVAGKVLGAERARGDPARPTGGRSLETAASAPPAWAEDTTNAR